MTLKYLQTECMSWLVMHWTAHIDDCISIVFYFSILWFLYNTCTCKIVILHTRAVSLPRFCYYLFLPSLHVFYTLLALPYMSFITASIKRKSNPRMYTPVFSHLHVHPTCIHVKIHPLHVHWLHKHTRSHVHTCTLISRLGRTLSAYKKTQKYLILQDEVDNLGFYIQCLTQIKVQSSQK